MADFIDPLGIDSEEAFDAPIIIIEASASGIDGEEAFGSFSFAIDVSLSGIDGEEAFGSADFISIVSLGGIASEESLGTLSSIYSYVSDGGEVVTSGAADTVQTYFIELDIEWQVKTVLNVEKSFSWDVGIQDLRWYRVQGCCKYPTAAGDGIDAGISGGCDIIGIETDDAGCTGALGKQQFIQNIVASGLSDLCQKLQDGGLRWEICSIKRFSKPADLRLANLEDDCNTLTEVPFCQIPACLDFCIQTDAIINMRMEVTVQTSFIYTGSGGAETSGSAITSTTGVAGSSSYEYESEGGEVVTSGSAITGTSWNTNLLVDMVMDISIDGEEATFSINPDAPEIPEITSTVSTNCGTCTDMPMILNLSHNLSKTGNLIEFLQRNGLVIPDALKMHYNHRLQSWVANYHLNGIGDDNLNSQEQWKFSFEWACVNQFAGVDFGGTSYWKFSMLVRRYNTTVGTDFDTRLVIIFPPGKFCNGNQSFAFDFSFKVNTITHFVENDVVALNEIVLVDNIGLFKSKSWTKNPLLRLRLTRSEEISTAKYQDIYPIFPTQTLQGVST